MLDAWYHQTIWSTSTLNIYPAQCGVLVWIPRPGEEDVIIMMTIKTEMMKLLILICCFQISGGILCGAGGGSCATKTLAGPTSTCCTRSDWDTCVATLHSPLSTDID